MMVSAPARSRLFRRTLLVGCGLVGLGAMTGTARAQAFAATPTTQFGNVTYDRATPGVETVRVETPTAVIDWRPATANFLPDGNIATFTNGVNNTDFVVLNRVIFPGAVRFDGTVLSRLVDALGTQTTGGTVIFSSPGGLIVGSTGVFDVGSLVLTTLNVNVDPNGIFYDPATRGITLDGGPSPLPGAAVVTEVGARLNALQPNSYVALIGQVVQHAGATRVNGSAAYVAGEQVTFRANQGLFDIIVSVGSDNAVPLSHTGSTGGPANASAADNHAIYLVAAPKNQAITALLQGDIGFDPAVTAGVENGVIVLSAGANVVGGQVDRYGHATSIPAPNFAANFEIRGGVVHSDLTGVARTSISARPLVTPTLTFDQDVSLFGGTSASIFAATGETVNILGNALVSTGAFDSFIPGQIDLTGGQSRIFATDGGAIHVFGTATVDASARGLVRGDGGSGTGGSADVTADGGGTVTVDGTLSILANGEGGASSVALVPNGGAGIGGTATLQAQIGGTVTANSAVTMSANGTASTSNAPTRDGAIGDGGTLNVLSTGVGTVVIGGIFTGSANGTGGNAFGGSFNGGAGSGGAINVGAIDSTLAFNSDANFAASGFGGAGPFGGDGVGGTLGIVGIRGTVDFFGQTSGSVDGTGGNAFGNTNKGGDGQGGQILIQTFTSDAPSRIGTGGLTLTATGRGGSGGSAPIGAVSGPGGDGTGGSVGIFAESGNGTIATGALTASANGLGGTGGASDTNIGGGNGGEGTGGTVAIGTSAGPGQGAPSGSATFASANLSANGIGGGGGFGTGTGGRGTGGTAEISATGAPVAVTGTTALAATGGGSAGGNSPSGAIGTGGQGAGGTVNILAAAHPNTNAPGNVTLVAVTGSTNASGAPTGNVAGSWHVGAGGGSTVSATDLTLTAAASGTGIGTPPASTLAPQNGLVTVSGTANLSTDGDIQVSASQDGRLSGGAYVLTALRNISVSHANRGALPTINVAGFQATANDNIIVNAGTLTRASTGARYVAGNLAQFAALVTAPDIFVSSADIDITATGFLGDANTNRIALEARPVRGQTFARQVVIGGNTAGPGYTLTDAEANRLRATTLSILTAPIGNTQGRDFDALLRDLNFAVPAGPTGPGVNNVSIIVAGDDFGVEGFARVEGNVRLTNAGATSGLSLIANGRLEVVTPTASIRVLDAAGAPAGTLRLASNNLWIASQAILDLLRADPGYAGRNDDLLDNDGVDAPRGYVEGGAVTLVTEATLFVQNTTPARGTFASGSDFGGITTGPGGLTIDASGATVRSVFAFGRRMNADGTFTTGDAFFFSANYGAAPLSNDYTPGSALNTCIIVTGQCPRRVPPDTGIDGKQPITGPTDGSIAILLPQNEEDDVIDSSFAADPLIEQPVTSGSEPGQWNCDPDHDGDCDDQPH